MAIQPVHQNSGTHDSDILGSAQYKMGVGQGLSFDPLTGKIQQATAASPGGFVNPKTGGQVVQGQDGKFYDVGPDGKPDVASGAYNTAAIQGWQRTPGAAAGQTDTGLTDPGWQIQQGVTDAAKLDPTQNTQLGYAAQDANNLANGKTGYTLTAPVQAGIDATQARIGNQAADLGIVRDSAMGRGPSAAENLAKSQLDSNIRSQSALAATARGGNIAAAMRQAAASGTQQSLQSASTLNALRAQEQLNAQGVLTQGANALTTAQGNLGNQNQNLAGLRGQMVQAGVSARQGVAGQVANDLGNENAAKQQAAAKYAEYLMNQYQIASGNQVAYSGQGVQAGIANQNNTTQLIGAGANALGTGLAAFTGH